MEFRIADTFTDSLARLTGDEQKAVKMTAFDLQIDPSKPGLSFHKLDRARDKNFWSVRVTSDLRLIVHKTAGSLLLCFVGHHDKAYDWAAKRRLETHPTTGAAQLVEIRETIQEIRIPTFVETPANVERKTPEPSPIVKELLFAHVPDAELLSFGVPTEWLADVRGATDATLLIVADHLPAEAAEALLELATGGKPRVAQLATIPDDPFEHPDALRRFRMMSNVDELERAFEFPWDKWTIFLHPEQRQWVEREQSGPARISGSAGTGKTVVALHRAVFLARKYEDARVLLATFSDILANDLDARMKRLVYHEPKLAERIDVYSVNAIGMRLYKARIGPIKLASRDDIEARIAEASKQIEGHKFSLHFLMTEWEQIVDEWRLDTWEAYRDVARLGRKTRLPEPQRAVLWSIFTLVQQSLAEGGLITPSRMYTELASAIAVMKHPPFDFAVVDEAQDISVAQLRFFAALGAARPDALFFAGDGGQRIFQLPFSWKSLGVDIRGRSRTLRINYRTSHQIRVQADRLLGREVSDVDGNLDERGDTVSVFNGPAPTIKVFDTQEEETQAVSAWLLEQREAGLSPNEFGVFVRSTAELARARVAVEQAQLPYVVLDEGGDPASGRVSISTMHCAKGLEFRAVVVMACDDEIIPLQQRIDNIGDKSDLGEVYDTERHLLYVACTRARDQLLVTSVDPASEFLDDLRGQHFRKSD